MKKLPALLCLAALALALPLLAAPKKLLVVTVTTGFRHSVIPVSEKIIEQLAAQSHGAFTVEFIHQPAGEPKAPAKPKPGKDGEQTPAFVEAMAKWTQADAAYHAARVGWMKTVAAALKPLAAANLKNFDGVIFASTTGDDLPLPDPQGFVDWVAAGGAFIGIHAATDTLKTFMPYVGMIGAAFKTHGPQVPVECINRDPANPACAPLPKVWKVYDEIYQMKNFERANVHELLSLENLMKSADEVKAKQGTPGDYPVAWTKMHGKGRVFYSSLGHREDMWDPTYKDKNGRMNSPEVAMQYQAHVRGGIMWALGLEKN
jgi:type 1 glutamine amidotransferase